MEVPVFNTNISGKNAEGKSLRYLLMPTLYRTVPVVEMDNVPVLIPHDLHLNVPRVVNEPAFTIHP
jgi:hypothetical protein